MRDYSILAYVSLLSPILPIALSLWRFRQLESEFKALVFLLIVGLSIDSALKWFYINSLITAFMMNIYVVVEYGLVMFIIMRWQSREVIKKILRGTILVYMVFWIIAKLSFEPLLGPYYLTGTIENIIITLSAAATLMLFDTTQGQILIRIPQFWILLAFVLYYAGMLLPTMFQGILYKHSLDSLLLVWSINWILSISANLLYSKGILCVPIQNKVIQTSHL
jgi:hypothetical protein